MTTITLFPKAIRHAIAVLAFSATFAACNSRTDAVQQMVDELNSPAFRAKEISTGLYTDSSAKLNGDTLVLAFECAPFIDLASVTADKLPSLHNETLKEFRNNLSNDTFKKGITELNNNDKTILLEWNDAKGHRVRIAVSPSEILK